MRYSAESIFIVKLNFSSNLNLYSTLHLDYESGHPEVPFNEITKGRKSCEAVFLIIWQCTSYVFTPYHIKFIFNLVSVFMQKF
jgi:hypothetical protein